MSESTMDGSGGRSSIAKIIGHYLDPFYPVLVMGSTLWSVFDPTDAILSGVISYTFTVVFFVVLACGVFAHYGRLCMLCAEAVPLDPQRTAARDRRWLRLSHSISKPIRVRGVPVLLGNFFIIAFAGLAIQGLIYFLFDPTPRVNMLVRLVAFSIPMATMFWAMHRHNRLQPWCPLCRWGRDDDDEEVPEPQPGPALSR